VQADLCTTEGVDTLCKSARLTLPGAIATSAVLFDLLS